MTVATGAAKAGPYTGNDSASAFAFAFKVFADTDIRVVATVIATGVESDLVLNTDYIVSRNVDQDSNPGGTVTYKVGGVTTAYPSTHKLTIVGDFVYEQPTDIPNGGSFFASVVETALDRLTLLVKQMKEQLDRAVTVDVSSSTDPALLVDSLLAAEADALAAQAAAETAQGLAEAAQTAAEAAAANLPNAPTAGADKFIQTNATGDGWDYHTAAQALAALGAAGLNGATFTGLVNFAGAADIASAATINLTTAVGNNPRVTGTTPTSAVTMNFGQWMILVADGAWPLTYHATTNKLNTGGANYTCAAGDVILYYRDQSGVVHGTIFPADGRPVTRDAIAFSGYLAAGTQSVTTNTWTKCNINTEEYDAGAMYDHATNYRFQPTVAGYYPLTFTAACSGTSVTSALAALYKNGVAHKVSQYFLTINDTTSAHVASDVYLNGTSDYVEFFGKITATNPAFVGGSTSTYASGHLGVKA